MLVRSCRSCFAAVSKLPPTCTVQTMYVRRRTGASCFFGGGEGGIGGLAFGRYRDSPFGPFLFSFSLHLFHRLLLLPFYEWKAVS